MDLLTQLGWKLAPTETPPPPPKKSGNRGGGNHDKWAHEIFNQLESLLWQIFTLIFWLVVVVIGGARGLLVIGAFSVCIVVVILLTERNVKHD